MYRRHEADDCARQTVSTRELSAQVDCPGDGPQAFRERRRGRSRESAGRARELGHVAELLRSQAGAWPAPDRRALASGMRPTRWGGPMALQCGAEVPALGWRCPDWAFWTGVEAFLLRFSSRSFRCQNVHG